MFKQILKHEKNIEYILGLGYDAEKSIADEFAEMK